jgi:hypothetical protein
MADEFANTVLIATSPWCLYIRISIVGAEDAGFFYCLRGDGMDQTVLPFSQMIEQQRRKWMPFKRALRKKDQEAFERLFECAKRQAQAEVYFPGSGSLEAVMLAGLLEHQRRIEEMLGQLTDGRGGRGEGRSPAVHLGAFRLGDTRQISLF